MIWPIFKPAETSFALAVRKVYPEVRDGKFRTDLVFTGERPENIRSGQTYYINLELGQPTESIIIPRGTFFQSTGGSWIFVLDKDGKKAYRRKIKIGRQNPQYYEVTEGLEAGEKVIVSSYESYKDNEVLVLGGRPPTSKAGHIGFLSAITKRICYNEEFLHIFPHPVQEGQT